MKKILLLLVMCIFFISCVSFPEVEYIGDAYYPDKGYFISAGGTIKFRTMKGTDKVVAIARYRFDNIMTVSKYHRVSFKFTDGKEISLSYNTRVSQYVDGRFELTATSGVIEDFGTLEIIRFDTDNGYKNMEVSEKWSKLLTTRFNMIQAEATAKYGSKE